MNAAEKGRTAERKLGQGVAADHGAHPPSERNKGERLGKLLPVLFHRAFSCEIGGVSGGVLAPQRSGSRPVGGQPRAQAQVGRLSQLAEIQLEVAPTDTGAILVCGQRHVLDGQPCRLPLFTEQDGGCLMQRILRHSQQIQSGELAFFRRGNPTLTIIIP